MLDSWLPPCVSQYSQASRFGRFGIRCPHLQVEAAAASLPKKAHWDLKRDIAARLDKLDRQTQRAIAEIVREKVRTQAELPPPAAALPALGVPAVAASGSGRGGATAAGASGSGAAAGADAEFDFSAAGLDPAALVRAVASAEAAASGGGFDDVDVAA